MSNKIKKSVLALAGLKAGQQILHDLDSIVLNNTMADIARYGTEQLCRFGSTGLAAYATDEIISNVEELTLPKYLRGTLPLLATTIGTGAVMHYLGKYMNMNIQEGTNFIQTTQNLLSNYQNNLAKLVTFNPTVHAGYLTGALISLKAGYRLVKNIGQAIMHKGEKKRVQNKFREEQEVQTINEPNSNQIPKGL